MKSQRPRVRSNVSNEHGLKRSCLPKRYPLKLGADNCGPILHPITSAEHADRDDEEPRCACPMVTAGPNLSFSQSNLNQNPRRRFQIRRIFTWHMGRADFGKITAILQVNLLAPLRNWPEINGAGEGNRTLVSGLGSPHSTIEPHPRTLGILLTTLPGQRNRSVLAFSSLAAWEGLRFRFPREPFQPGQKAGP